MCCSVACHRYGRTASVTAMLNDLKWETLDTRRNNQKKQKIRSRPDLSSAVCPDRRLQILFLPCNCMYVECTTSIGDPVWDTPSKQVSVITTATEPRHVTIDHQCVILDHRELHFTGRWEDELFPQNLSKMYQKTMVLLHESDDNVAVVATTVAISFSLFLVPVDALRVMRLCLWKPQDWPCCTLCMQRMMTSLWTWY